MIIDRQKFSGLVSDQKLAYLLIRAIEHPDVPTPYRPSSQDVADLRTYLFNRGLATRIPSQQPPVVTEPA